MERQLLENWHSEFTSYSVGVSIDGFLLLHLPAKVNLGLSSSLFPPGHYTAEGRQRCD